MLISKRLATLVFFAHKKKLLGSRSMNEREVSADEVAKLLKLFLKKVAVSPFQSFLSHSLTHSLTHSLSYLLYLFFS